MKNDIGIIKILGLISAIIMSVLIVDTFLLTKQTKPEVCKTHSFIKDEYWIMTMKSNDAKEFLRRPTLVCKECGMVRYKIIKGDK